MQVCVCNKANYFIRLCVWSVRAAHNGNNKICLSTWRLSECQTVRDRDTKRANETHTFNNQIELFIG